MVWSYRRDISVLDVETWQPVGEYVNTIAISHIEFTPDGAHLVIGDWFVELTVIETEDWTEVHRLEGQQGVWLSDMAIDPTGAFVATAGLENDAWIWDIETGELGEKLEIPPLTVGLRNVEWVDEETLYLGTRPVGFLMTLDPDQLVMTARSTLTRTFTDEECATYGIVPCPTLEQVRGEV